MKVRMIKYKYKVSWMLNLDGEQTLFSASTDSLKRALNVYAALNKRFGVKTVITRL